MEKQTQSHWDKYKYYYMAAGTILICATASTLAYNKGLVEGFEFSDSSQKVIVGNGILNRNNVEVNLLRRGHPGNKILCNQTGEVFASQQRAATANDISPSSLSEHLRGLRDSVNGLTFEKLGEMV